jgi:two-component system, OmpR family, response regulator MprA
MGPGLGSVQDKESVRIVATLEVPYRRVDVPQMTHPWAGMHDLPRVGPNNMTTTASPNAGSWEISSVSDAHILVVDDDESIRSALQRGLVLEGYSVAVAASGAEAFQRATARFPDAVVLDILMPGLDGLEVCRRLRSAEPSVAIIMLTAKDAVADRVIGLENGADDYLVKPFAFAELIARIRVCLRRRSVSDPRELRFADLRLDTRSREVWRAERPISLTTTEFELLRLFLQTPRQVLKRERIYEGVWGYTFEGESKVIEVYVSQLRQKMESSGESRLIHTIRGAGYVLREAP